MTASLARQSRRAGYKLLSCPWNKTFAQISTSHLPLHHIPPCHRDSYLHPSSPSLLPISVHSSSSSSSSSLTSLSTLFHHHANVPVPTRHVIQHRCMTSLVRLTYPVAFSLLLTPDMLRFPLDYWTSSSDKGPTVHCFPHTATATCVYVVWDEASKKAVIFDSCVDYDMETGMLFFLSLFLSLSLCPPFHHCDLYFVASIVFLWHSISLHITL